jgi:hypothetical protein
MLPPGALILAITPLLDQRATRALLQLRARGFHLAVVAGALRLAQTLAGLAGRTSPVKNVGKPCPGKPHAQFDGRGLETDHGLWHRANPRPSHLAADGGAAG